MLLMRVPWIITFNKRDDILRDSYIGVDEESGKIIYIGREKPKDLEIDELIELRGSIILPGFINSHTHIPMVLLRGLKDDVNLRTWLFQYIFPAEDQLKAEDIYYGSLQGIAEMIESGVTTFFDMYMFEEEIAKAVYETGIRAVLSRGILDFTPDRTPETELKKSLDFLNFLEKIWSRDPSARERIFFAFGPHAPYTCSKELLTLIREKANKMKEQMRNTLINIHVAETKREYEEFKKKYGLSPIQYLDSIDFLDSDVLSIHTVWVDDKDLDILSQRNVKVSHNPASNLKLGSGIAPIPKMIEKGIFVALGTDGAASNNRLDILGEARLAALLHKGVNRNSELLPAKKVLKMITIDAAKALGLDKYIGSIEVGKYADLVVLNLKKVLQSTPFHDLYSLIVYSLDLRAIDAVMVGGRWLYRKGEFLTISHIDNILEKVSLIRKSIEEKL